MYKINTSMSIFSILFVTFAPDFLIASVQMCRYPHIGQVRFSA